MANLFGLQRRVLSVLIACYLAGVLLVGLLVLGVYLWNKTDDRHTVTDISYSEIGSSLHYKGEVFLPTWEIEKVELYNDQFTSPYVTVDFGNGVSLEVYTSHYTARGSKEFAVKKGGLTYRYIPPESMADAEIAKLKKEVSEM